jgi:hypothetical protein
VYRATRNSVFQVEAMADFCYSGWESPRMDELAFELLTLATRYGIVDLLEHCVHVLRGKINIHNWCSIIKAAESIGYRIALYLILV